MKIRNVRHRGLRKLIEDDDASELQAPFVDKIRKILSFLQDMGREQELRGVPGWKGSSVDGRSEGNLESVRLEELAHHVSNRGSRNRNHRSRLRGLSLEDAKYDALR